MQYIVNASCDESVNTETQSIQSIRAAPTMNSSAALSSTVLLVLAAAVCSSATEWSPEDIGNIASAAANSRELQTLDVSEHLCRQYNTISQ